MLATQCRDSAGSRSGAESGAVLRDLLIDDGEEQGVYGVKFFVNGSWRTVVVDDYIPCTETKSGMWTPCFAQTQPDRRNRLALWPLIFLKAWAKLHGSYEATAGGHVDDALNYLTGGLCTPINLNPDTSSSSARRSPRSPRSPTRRSKAADPWEDLIDATADTDDPDFPVFVVATLKNMSSRGSSSAWEKEIEDMGLEKGQAYEVLCATELGTSGSGSRSRSSRDSGEQLVCLWSPWSVAEYSGDYCRQSDEYRQAKSELQRLDRTTKPLLGGGLANQSSDNMFWMRFEDFKRVFGEVGVCDPWTAGCINPNVARRFLTEDGVMVARQGGSALDVNLNSVHGNWVAGVSAGGTADDETFEHNPTYELECDGDYAAVSLFQRDPRVSDSKSKDTEECAPISLYLVTERIGRGDAVPEEQELVKLTEPHHRTGSRTIPLAPGCRRWLVAAAEEPGVIGEFWITASAQSCRLVESTPARPDRDATDAMRANRSSRTRR